MSQWLRPITRWAIYLRDDLQCAYCRVTMREILASQTGDNFLTIDHFLTRSRGGTNDPKNLVTACYDCNMLKGRGNLRELCRAKGWNYHTTRARVRVRRNRDLEPFRQAARMALGLVPGFPRAETVRLHDWLARTQWMGEYDQGLWEQKPLLCHACGKPEEEEVPF